MRKLLALLAWACATPVAMAQQQDAEGFFKYTTNTDCVFLMDISPLDSVKGHIWSEACRPGELISGTGSMITLTDSYVDDRGRNIQYARVRTGPWINGKMHGRLKFENATSTNGGQWTVIPDDCGENWCQTIYFTYDMGFANYDTAIWGDVDTYAGAVPAAPAPKAAAI